MPEDIHSQSNPGEFESPLDSSDNHADLVRDQDTSSPHEADQTVTETSEQPSVVDKKTDRKAKDKSPKTLETLINNARKASMPGMKEALADLEVTEKNRE